MVYGHLQRFLRDERGAVSVDWVALTAATVGVGLAGSAAVLIGTSELSDDLKAQLEGQTLSSTFNTVFEAITYRDDFETGTAPGWSVQTVDASQVYYGGILGPFGGTGGQQMVHKTYELNPEAAFAVLSFDIHAIDSWDSEDFTVFLNDAPISGMQFEHRANGLRNFWVDEASGVAVEIAAMGERQQLGYSSRWPDQSFQMKVVVPNAGDEIKLGFGTGLNQSIDDESWAVDNVEVASTNDPEV